MDLSHRPDAEWEGEEKSSNYLGAIAFKLYATAFSSSILILISSLDGGQGWRVGIMNSLSEFYSHRCPFFDLINLALPGMCKTHKKESYYFPWPSVYYKIISFISVM